VIRFSISPSAGVREKTPSSFDRFEKGPRPLSAFIPAVCPSHGPPRHRGGPWLGGIEALNP
jgi:hypothetical protein